MSSQSEYVSSGAAASAAAPASSFVVGDEVVPSPELTLYKSFDDMGLTDDLLRGIYSFGFEKPSAIQQKGVVPIREGRDILAQAQSGTGKTGTFTIGSLSRIDPSLKQVQVLILVHVRELAHQIATVVNAIGNFMHVTAHCATGGPPIKDDIRAIEKGCQVLVGTPGRIYDLMYRNYLHRENIKVLVMDEADQMLQDKFREQVMHILRMGFPKETQVALFSATMPEEVIEVADTLLHNPVRILVDPSEVPLEGITQFFVPLDREEWKYDTLCDLYQQININQALIYCNKRQKAEWLAKKMTDQGFPLGFIHGEMDIEERKQRMAEFRNGTVRVMISTDMLARGIDVQQVSLVINYELPNQKENYIHRIGRAGRFGRKGVTINLISQEEGRAMEEIEKHYNIKLSTLPQNLAMLPL